jgi:hypothetical protein
MHDHFVHVADHEAVAARERQRVDLALGDVAQHGAAPGRRERARITASGFKSCAAENSSSSFSSESR